VQGQTLGGDSNPTLTTNFSRVMRVSTGAEVSFTPSIEQSVMISKHDRGHNHDRDCGRDFGRMWLI